MFRKDQTKHLQGAVLSLCILKKVNFSDALLQGADLLGAQPQNKTLKKALQNAHHHNKWNIEPILEDMSKKSQKFFLQGVLRNFAEKDKEEPTPWALQCRLAVRKLQKSHEDLWNALDHEWTEWLEALDKGGLSPDERKDDE